MHQVHNCTHLIRSLSSHWFCELLQCDSYGNVWTKMPCHSKCKVFFLQCHAWFSGAHWVYLHGCKCSYRNRMGTWHSSGDTPDGDVASSLPDEEWCRKCHIALVRCTAQMDSNQVCLCLWDCPWLPNCPLLENSFPLPADSSTVKLQNRKWHSFQLLAVTIKIYIIKTSYNKTYSFILVFQTALRGRACVNSLGEPRKHPQSHLARTSLTTNCCYPMCVHCKAQAQMQLCCYAWATQLAPK